MRNFLFIIILLLTITVSAQKLEVEPQTYSKQSGFMFGLGMGYHTPAGDLADRFGSSANANGGFMYKTRRNFVFGLMGNFIFGKKIKEPILTNIQVGNGGIVNNFGEYAGVALFERGYYVMLSAGKIININSKQPNSGLFFNLGGGFMEHKIRIQVENNDIAALSNERKKGYDRLTNGIASEQFLGYMHLSNDKRVNFYVGLNFVEGFTKNRRNWNYDTNEKDDNNRFDMLIGIKGGWILPLYKKTGARKVIY